MDFIKAQMKVHNVQGLSLIVVKDGEIIKAEGYGLANVRLKIAGYTGNRLPHRFDW